MTTNDKNPNKIQWWVMAAMWGVILAGGSGWATHVNNRITRLEDIVANDLPRVREIDTLNDRLDRIETKLDLLLTQLSEKGGKKP